jgi:cation transport ATPase
LFSAVFLLVYELTGIFSGGNFGSISSAGISIVASVLLHEYLAGAIVVLMLSGGEALEGYALRNASSVLRALANGCLPRASERDSVIADVAG